MRVTDTKAGKQVSALIILDPEGKYVAKVQAHHGASRVTVSTWVFLDPETDQRTDYCEGSASGYGYDKFTSALSATGMTVRGIKVYDHAQSSEELEALVEQAASMYPLWTREQKIIHEDEIRRRYGASFANYGADGIPKSCYYTSGLDRLKDFGYTVIQAI